MKFQYLHPKKHFLTVLIFIIAVPIQAQQIKNLVFEGAGIRGLAYAGAINELESRGLLDQIEKTGGTSAGAIMAMMVSLGYSATEIDSIISSTNFKRFNDGHMMFPGGIRRMKNWFGWYRGDRFLKWTANIIQHKTGNPDITFSQLSAAGYTDLYITATCLNRQQLIVFSKETYPNMKLKDAVRASVSIPLYFQAVFIDSTGNVIRKPKQPEKYDIVIDGGITGNYPIFIFDSVITLEDGSNQRIPNPHTVGFRIDSDNQIKQDSVEKRLTPLKINNFSDYITAFYIYTLENLNRNMLTKEDWERTVSISSAGIGPKIKRLSKKQKDTLIRSGNKSTATYLNDKYPG